MKEQLSIGYATRVKTILAVGFIRLCFILALQIQMLNHVDPDGSFSVSLLFAVLLVDGGGMITALTFLLQNPVLSEILHRLTSTVCKEDGLEGCYLPSSSFLIWWV